MRKNNLKNTIVKFVAGMLLTCSLLTALGSVSNEQITPYADVVVGDRINIVKLANIIIFKDTIIK